MIGWDVLEYVTRASEEKPRCQATANLAERGVGMPGWWLKEGEDGEEAEDQN